MPQPKPAANNAVPQPRRTPRRRKDAEVVTTAITIATATRQEHPADGHRQQGHPPSLPVHGGAPTPHSRSPKRLATSSTSDWRGWNDSAWSTSKISEAFVAPPNSRW